MSISNNGVTVQNEAESSLVVEVKELKNNDPIQLELKNAIHNQRMEVFSQEGDCVLRQQGKFCASDVGKLRQRIIAEVLISRYCIHPISTKMYHDLWEVYWWNVIKRDIADFVSKCPNSHQVRNQEE